MGLIAQTKGQIHYWQTQSVEGGELTSWCWRGRFVTRWLRRKNHSALTNLMRIYKSLQEFAGCVEVIHVVNIFVLQFVCSDCIICQLQDCCIVFDCLDGTCQCFWSIWVICTNIRCSCMFARELQDEFQLICGKNKYSCEYKNPLIRLVQLGFFFKISLRRNLFCFEAIIILKTKQILPLEYSVNPMFFLYISIWTLMWMTMWILMLQVRNSLRLRPTLWRSQQSYVHI